jgi:CubicO group peptidase (beta-lactamase class C family)
VTPQINESLEKLFSPYNQPNTPGGSFGVISDSKLVVERAWGLANLKTGEKCSSQTNFRLASVSKQFTAVAFLMVAHQEKLSLDREVASFFPELSTCAAGVTLRHLLTHTSGLPDYEDYIPKNFTRQVKDADVVKLISETRSAYFQAGEKFRYTNTGYILLALLVEKLACVRFAEFLRERIFMPLGMTHTVAFEEGGPAVPHRALGYTGRENGFEETDQSQTSATLGDGGIYSSVIDMAKWDHGLYGDKLLPQSVLHEALKPQAGPTDMKGYSYGYGWYVADAPAEPHQWHYGTTCGFSTRFERFSGRQLSYVILLNRSGVDMIELGQKIAAVLTGK